MTERAEEYEGRSLLYIRTILSCPARWPSAKDAVAELTEHLRVDFYPVEVGAVCFYDMEPWGDIGVYVGAGRVLRIESGQPALRSMDGDADFIGWVPGRIFQAQSQGRNPLAL